MDGFGRDRRMNLTIKAAMVKGLASGPAEAPAGSTLVEFLAEHGFNETNGLILLVNGRIRPDDTRLADGDEIRVLPVMGGG